MSLRIDVENTIMLAQINKSIIYSFFVYFIDLIKVIFYINNTEEWDRNWIIDKRYFRGHPKNMKIGKTDEVKIIHI